MAKPFKVVTREDAAENLSVSLSTIDNMIASGALPPPKGIPGSRRKYWHPDVFFGCLERLLLNEQPEQQRDSASTQYVKPAKKTALPTNSAQSARARDAARLARLNE